MEFRDRKCACMMAFNANGIYSKGGVGSTTCRHAIDAYHAVLTVLMR